MTPIPRNAGERVPSSDALSVTADPVDAVAGSSGELVVHLRVGSEFHLMSNAPSKPHYVPTRVAASGPAGVTFAEALYPPATRYRFEDEDLGTFQGNVAVALPFTLDENLPEGDHAVTGSVHYQACTEGRCLFPQDAPFRATLHVTPKR